MKYINYVLAVAILLALIPLEAQAAAIDLEVSDSNKYDEGTFSVTDSSLPYQFSVSSTPGFKLSSITLYKKVDNNYIPLFTFYNVESLKLEIMLEEGEYELRMAAGDGRGMASATGSPVPIPSSILLFGTSLVGLIGLGRRQKNASPSIPHKSSTKRSDRTVLLTNWPLRFYRQVQNLAAGLISLLNKSKLQWINYP